VRPPVVIELRPVDAGPEPEATGLGRFGTVAFDAAMMRHTLRFDGATGAIEAGWWLHVPECYRARVREIVLETFEREGRGRKGTPEHIDTLIAVIRRAIWRHLEPIHPELCATLERPVNNR
jgi:hypothetical protein